MCDEVTPTPTGNAGWDNKGQEFWRQRIGQEVRATNPRLMDPRGETQLARRLRISNDITVELLTRSRDAKLAAESSRRAAAS